MRTTGINVTDQYFPIKTATACSLKWTWSTLYLNSNETASCHRTGFSKLTLENFDNFHNTEKKISEREAMLKGQWPVDSCSYCRNIELAGGFSDRMLHSKIPGQVPVELVSNTTATTVTPTILEVFFKNTCNLSCLYCLPELSSKINQENQKFGKFEKNSVELSTYTPPTSVDLLIEKFWDWMQINSHNLKRFNILGGEPFYQQEFDRCLDYFESSMHPDLEIGIVTNLSMSQDRLEVYLDRFKSLLAKKQIKRIDLTCSIDCLGPEQEFVRHGLDLEQWIKNFELLLQKKWLTLNINQTISLLTIKTMPELLQKMIQWREIKPIGHYFSEVSPHPSYLMSNVLGSGIFEDDFEIILNLMPVSTEKDQLAKKYMQGIADSIVKSQRNTSEILKLKTFLDEKDRRRGTNWRKTFPWLECEIDHVV